MRELIVPCVVLLLAGCGHKSPSDAPATSAPREGTLQIISLNRLQGLGGPVPCQADDIGVLPAAAELRDRLAAAGDTALLVAVGDACNRSYKPVHGKAAEVSNIARTRVALEALAASKVDAYVPGHGDLATGFDDLLARCDELGIPVLLSNVASPAHAKIKPWMMVEAGTLRIGLLGIIPSLVADSSAPEPEVGKQVASKGVEYPGASMLPVEETVSRLVGELREKQGADIVVLLSSLSQKGNTHLSAVKGLDLVIGSTDTGFDADRIIFDESTAIMSSGPAGRQVGHTTVAIRNGNMQMADMSPAHGVVLQIAAVEERLAEYAQRFGTEDPATLARLVAPDDVQGFLNMVALMEENKEFVKIREGWDDSYIDHRAAELLPPRPDHPALAVMAGEGPAIEAAIAAADLKPLVIPEGRPIIPKAEDCKGCHTAQYEFWLSTSHSRAFTDLAALHEARDVSCLECHAAGFEVPNGWTDPRFDGPFGGVTCFQCHDSYAPHSSSARQVVDPKYVHADATAMDCASCHIERRSPGFDKEAVLASVSCPPMRADEPALLLARQAAIDAIAARRAKGIAEPRDDYLEGRALVGLGAFEEGYAILERFAADNADNGSLRVEIARLFERSGNSHGAIELLRKFLETHAGDPECNLEYITLLLAAGDVEARDPHAALAQIGFLLPKDAVDSRKVALDFRVLEIDAYFATGQPEKGLALINELSREHSGDPRLKLRVDRYISR